MKPLIKRFAVPPFLSLFQEAEAQNKKTDKPFIGWEPAFAQKRMAGCRICTIRRG